MDESIHKFLCPCCKIFIFGVNTIRLASNLNEHNSDKHPFESSDWTAAGIVFSAHYIGPVVPNANWGNDAEVAVDTRKGPRPEYTVPHGTNENSRMTPEGRKVLEGLGVKW